MTQLALPRLPLVATHLLVTVPGAIVVSFGAAASFRRARKAQGRTRAGWSAAAIANALLAMVYTTHGCNAVLPLPAFDLIGLAAAAGAAACAATGVMLWGVPSESRLARLIQAIDTIAVAGALFVLAWEFLLDSAAAAMQPAARTLLIQSNLAEFVLFAVALVVTSRSSTSGRVHVLHLIVGGLAAFITQGLLEARNAFVGDPWYEHGAGACSIIGGLLVALVGYRRLPTADATERRWFSGVWVTLPYVPVVVAFVAVVGVYLWQGTVQQTLVWAMFTVFGLVLVRQFCGVLVVKNLLRRVDEQQSLLHYQANHDALTGLSNRASFQGRAAESLAATRADDVTAVLLLDLDGFKAVNDTHGHAAGDHVLVTVGQRLSATMRRHGSVSRLGGDEFVVLLPHLTDAGDARSIATRIIEQLGKPIGYQATTLQIGVSIGIAVVSGADDGLDTVLHYADQALYAAKNAGKNTYRYHDADQERTTAQF